eukprot:5404023-Pleurochrysis_carterae.AAC.1
MNSRCRWIYASQTLRACTTLATSRLSCPCGDGNELFFGLPAHIKPSATRPTRTTSVAMGGCFGELHSSSAAGAPMQTA